jgi:capsular polysaccharide biosynthesis protein
MKKFFLRPPGSNDFIHLLFAWRVWMAGAILGTAVASILYLVIPPRYRAQATVLVDQNVEQVVPQEQSDLQKFNYLKRETEKLVGIVWSDQTLARVGEQTGYSLAQLRDGRLSLTQPGDGSWHFLAYARDPLVAAKLASAWAGAFVAEVQASSQAIAPLLEVNVTEQKDLPVSRVPSLGIYVFSGSFFGVVFLAIMVFVIDRKNF